MKTIEFTDKELYILKKITCNLKDKYEWQAASHIKGMMVCNLFIKETELDLDSLKEIYSKLYK